MKWFRKSAILPLLLIIAVLAGFLHLNNVKNDWKARVSVHNYNHWADIHLMAQNMDEMGYTRETIANQYGYINAKVYSATDGLSPDFSGDSKANAFLNTYYISLAMDIANNAYGDNQQKAIDLFTDATKDLKDLTGKILKLAEDSKSRDTLLDTDSKLYIQVETMVKEYCNKYSAKISEFNEEYFQKKA